MKSEPLVSIVIPTFNSGKHLKDCLDSIRKQTYRNVEVIVVDSFSEDNTRELAKNDGARVFLCRNKRSGARNIGARLAKGVFIFSIDSDMELTHHVIGECVAKATSGFDAIVIPEVSVGDGFWARCRALEKSCYVGDELVEAVRFMRRQVFERVNGYDAELEFGEDWDMHTRVKNSSASVGRTRAVIRHHEGELRLRDVVKKKYGYGRTLKLYLRKNPQRARAQLRIVRPSFVRNWKKFAGDPAHSLGLIFMKACEYVSSGLAYLSTMKDNS